MKVLQIIPTLEVAGAEIMCENLCYALQNQGCDVIAVSLYTKHTPITQRLEDAGIKLLYLDKKSGFDPSIYVKLYRLIKKEQPGVVHTHIGAARYALPIAVLCGVPARIHTVHSIAQQEQNSVGKKINKFLFRHCGVVPVALSEKVKETIEAVYALPPQRIPVIFNGVDLAGCQVKSDYARGKTFKIIHVGRFADVKNHELLLNAFASFAQRHSDVRLQLLGEGELKEKMQHLAQELQIENAVEFAGLQSDVHPWLHNADLFVLPSKYEGMPMTLIEAMGTGLPIIASALGGIPDMLTDGISALLIEPDQVRLCEAMEQLYADASLRKQLGEKALVRSRFFSNEKMAEQYVDVYKATLS